MDLILANPAGLWMLLGLPAVLVIHLLQNRSPRIPVSTLFLLDQLAEEEHRGSVLDRLRNSVALWLQLLAVLLLTLLLVRPMPLRSDSAQAVAIVLDNSNSMRAFKPTAQRELASETRRLAARAATTEWFLQTTDPSRPTLYSGTSRSELLEALGQWHPDSAEHDGSTALRRAAELAGPGGLAVFVTDHIPEAIPPAVALLAVGEPLDNAGFGSLVVTPASDGFCQWRATLINHCDHPQQRELALERDGVAASPESITLSPHQVRVLRGEMPADTGQMTLTLHPNDAFPLDDTLYLLPVHRRKLPVQLALGDSPLRDWALRVVKATPDAAVVEDSASAGLVWVQADLSTSAGSTIRPPASNSAFRIVLASGPGTNTPVTGEVVAETDPLTRDLSWHGFLCNGIRGEPLAPGDEPLLWMAGEPLILLRNRADGGTDLELRFDIATSNAERHPAVILLLNRFMERARRTLPGDEAGIVELNQRLDPPPAPGRGPRELYNGPPGTDPAISLLPEAAAVYAPANPGFFQVHQAGIPVFSGAAIFTETREADFQKASSRNDLAGQSPAQTRIYRRNDFLTPLWLALLGLAILASWFATSNTRFGAP